MLTIRKSSVLLRSHIHLVEWNFRNFRNLTITFLRRCVFLHRSPSTMSPESGMFGGVDVAQVRIGGDCRCARC